MKLRLMELRRIIGNIVNEELNVDKPYTNALLDDEAFKARSVYVPDDIKDSIERWSETMLLRRRSRTSRSKKK